VSKVAAAPQVKLAKVRAVRKNIAKVLTVINEKRRTAARDAFAKKKYTPYDLRAKKTRASRRKMTRFERTKETPRAFKRSSNNKMRKFALAA
jgi:large subunit ribosomal protein L35e